MTHRKTEKKTIGQQIKELQDKRESSIEDIPEATYAQQADYIKNLEYCVRHALKETPCTDTCKTFCKERPKFDGDFYVVNLLKAEKVGALRSFFFPKLACPTPTFDQIVFKYDHVKGDLKLIWSIPCKEACKYYQEMFIKHKNEIDPSEFALAENVIKFVSGEYDILCAKLNDELNKKSAVQSMKPEHLDEIVKEALKIREEEDKKIIQKSKETL